MQFCEIRKEKKVGIAMLRYSSESERCLTKRKRKRK
jgi:hypothetical protein